MEESAQLPSYFESSQIDTKPVLIAKFSQDGRFFAMVHEDYSLSVWESLDILVKIYDKTFFQQQSSSSSHIVFLDWSANCKYLYLIVDCNGFLIDMFSSEKITRSFK